VNNRVIETAGRNDRTRIRRRRVCIACEERFTTQEILVEDAIVSRKELRAQLVDLARTAAELANGLA
jgi:transcriptional regulator NrdR family protein